MQAIRDFHALLLQLLPWRAGLIGHVVFFMLVLSGYQAVALWAIRMGRQQAGARLPHTKQPLPILVWAARQPGAWPLASLRWLPLVGEAAMWHLGAAHVSPWTARAVAAITATLMAWSWTCAMAMHFSTQDTWLVIALNGALGGVALKWLIQPLRRWMVSWGLVPDEPQASEDR